MVGIILFYVSYIIAFFLLYTIMAGCYKRQPLPNKKSWESTKYEKTDIKVKHPLWLHLLFIILWFVPVVNIGTYVLYMCFTAGDCDSEVYYKSFLTKEY